MEAIPPHWHTFPQRAPLHSNTLSPITQLQNFSANSAPQPSANDLYYEQLAETMSTETLASLGTGEDIFNVITSNLEDHDNTEVRQCMDELMNQYNGFFSDAEAIARWNLTGNIDSLNSGNIIVELGDLSCYENATACVFSNMHHT